MSKTLKIPGHLHPLYSEEEIRIACKKLGAAISPWASEVWQKGHSDILALPILRGGIFFFADLVRQISTSVEVVPVSAATYEEGQNAVPKEQTQAKLNLDHVAAAGRSVLLIDDICDSGRTLELSSKKLVSMGAREVKSAVLVRRILDTPSFAPDWVGFEYKGPEWLVGYGMEDANRWRNLPSIYIIRKNSN